MAFNRLLCSEPHVESARESGELESYRVTVAERRSDLRPCRETRERLLVSKFHPHGLRPRTTPHLSDIAVGAGSHGSIAIVAGSLPMLGALEYCS